MQQRKVDTSSTEWLVGRKQRIKDTMVKLEQETEEVPETTAVFAPDNSSVLFCLRCGAQLHELLVIEQALDLYLYYPSSLFSQSSCKISPTSWLLFYSSPLFIGIPGTH